METEPNTLRDSLGAVAAAMSSASAGAVSGAGRRDGANRSEGQPPPPRPDKRASHHRLGMNGLPDYRSLDNNNRRAAQTEAPHTCGDCRFGWTMLERDVPPTPRRRSHRRSLLLCGTLCSGLEGHRIHEPRGPRRELVSPALPSARRVSTESWRGSTTLVWLSGCRLPLL
jgi:hypothetical protein